MCALVGHFQPPCLPGNTPLPAELLLWLGPITKKLAALFALEMRLTVPLQITSLVLRGLESSVGVSASLPLQEFGAPGAASEIDPRTSIAVAANNNNNIPKGAWWRPEWHYMSQLFRKDTNLKWKMQKYSTLCWREYAWPARP